MQNCIEIENLYMGNTILQNFSVIYESGIFDVEDFLFSRDDTMNVIIWKTKPPHKQKYKRNRVQTR